MRDIIKNKVSHILCEQNEFGGKFKNHSPMQLFAGSLFIGFTHASKQEVAELSSKMSLGSSRLYTAR